MWRDGSGGERDESWPRPAARVPARLLDTRKFRDAALTAKGERRAAVALGGLETLWFNTGTLCNIACEHCYIESSPRNDRLSYLTLAEMRAISTRSRATACRPRRSASPAASRS